MDDIIAILFTVTDTDIAKWEQGNVTAQKEKKNMEYFIFSGYDKILYYYNSSKWMF